VVDRHRWMDARAFEDANAACGMLPGPASTQMAIYCAYRVAGPAGAVIGGLGFIAPAVAIILALSAVVLGHSPPLWVRGAGAGAGAAVPAVALQAARSLLGPSLQRARSRSGVRGWTIFVIAGAVAAVLVGADLVLVLVACGALEVMRRRRGTAPLPAVAWPTAVATVSAGGYGALAWTAVKVGALSFGGGFVIIPLMQGDAVHVNHWMTNAQFLNAVALGQITPGPVVQTVAVVGYAAAGLAGGLIASLVAFTPSFIFVLAGGPRFDRIRGDHRARAFLDGAGPAAIGAILGSAITLARALSHPWQYAVLAAALILLLPLRRGVVLTLLAAAVAGVVIALAAGTISL